MTQICTAISQAGLGSSKKGHARRTETAKSRAGALEKLLKRVRGAYDGFITEQAAAAAAQRAAAAARAAAALQEAQAVAESLRQMQGTVADMEQVRDLGRAFRSSTMRPIMS